MDASHTRDAAIDDQTSTTSTVLLVPMRIDALCLTGDTNVRQALADYSKLPYLYNDPTEGWTPSPGYVSNLSDNILSQPCSGASMNLRLGAGIHLHWALPEALTHSVDQDADGAPLFPVVPNRWLVTRRRGQSIEKQWVVESDYLAPDMTWLPPALPPADSVAVPFPFVDFIGDDGPYQPFRFMGRKVDPAQWSPGDPKGADYLRHYEGQGGADDSVHLPPQPQQGPQQLLRVAL